MDKNKKILKGIGIGALACVGMIGLTGCSKVEIGQDKVNSMIETVEKVDTRLDEYVDLLEKANRMTKEEAWNLAQMADYNYEMNIDGVRDNVVITSVSADSNENIECYFYNSGSTSSYVSVYSNGLRLNYQTNDSNVIEAEFDKTTNGYLFNSYRDCGEYALFDNEIGSQCVIRGNGLTYDNLAFYNVLENGNVELTFIKEITNYTNQEKTEYVSYIDSYIVEYSQDAKLLSVKYASKVTDFELLDPHMSWGMILECNNYKDAYKFELNYGVVDTEFVDNLIALAEEERRL